MFKPKKFKLSKEEELILAESILAVVLSYPITLSREYSRTMHQHLKDIETKDGLLEYVKELHVEPETPRQRYLFAMSFYKYNHLFIFDAIKYLALYVTEPPFEDIYKDNKMWFAGEKLDMEALKGQHLADMYKLLGECCEKNDEFGFAITAYKEELKHLPYYPHAYERIANIYKTLNRPELVASIYKKAKSSPFYKPIEYMEDGNLYIENGFKFFIDKKLEEEGVQNKEEKE